MSDTLEPVRLALLAVHRTLIDDARESTSGSTEP